MTFRLKIPRDLIGLKPRVNHDYELIIANLLVNLRPKLDLHN